MGGHQGSYVLGQLSLVFLDLMEVGWTPTVLAEGGELSLALLGGSEHDLVGFVALAVFDANVAELAPDSEHIHGSSGFHHRLLKGCDLVLLKFFQLLLEGLGEFAIFGQVVVHILVQYGLRALFVAFRHSGAQMLQKVLSHSSFLNRQGH